MPTTHKNLDPASPGEDIYVPYSAASTADTSDWSDWEIEAYLFDKNDVKRVTCKAADSTLVKTAEGEFYLWIKSASTAALSVGRYFVQTWRIDADHRFCLHSGILELVKQPLPS